MTILTLKAIHYKLNIQLTIKANNIAIFFLCNSGYVFLLFSFCIKHIICCRKNFTKTIKFNYQKNCNSNLYDV